MAGKTIITRAGWNARPPKRRFGRRLRTVGIVIHHSGVQNGPKGPKALKQFERTHMDVRGWNAIAYNWLVDEDGVIYHGRGPGIVGGATRGWNSKTESICYTGWGSDPLPDKARESMKWLVDHLQGEYGSKLWVKRHRDFAATACPGGWLSDWVGQGMPASRRAPEPDLHGVLQYLNYLGQQVAKRYLSRRRRSRGDAVKVVQQRLADLGLNPGPVDGEFGPKTDRAVRAFQGKWDLKVDGKVGPNTWKALMEA